MHDATEYNTWLEKLVPIVQAACAGATIEYEDLGKWYLKQHDDFVYGYTYRIKPKTIRIGEYDVPEPMRERPLNDERVHLVCTDCAIPTVFLWEPTEYSLYLLTSGLVHREHASAALHLKALLSLTKVGV